MFHDYPRVHETITLQVVAGPDWLLAEVVL